MARIRALVVDDSTVVRRMLSEIISDSDDFEVAGTAANGKIALAKIPQLLPDVVTLDMEMPEMGGLETIKEIRRSYPTLPIVLFSAFVASEGKETRNAINCGANDFVTKPTKAGSPEHAKLLVRNELLPKLRKLHRQVRNNSGADRVAAQFASGLPPAVTIPSVRPVQPITPRKNPISPIELIAIGVSTGGPNALSHVLSGLDRDLPVPILIVQHMPPVFTKHLADRLSNTSSLVVREGIAGVELKPGEVWIAPGDYHMTVQKNGTSFYLNTNQGPAENSCRPAVDVLFRSVAECCGSGALGCVLTGMGQDGLRGAEVLRNAGAFVIAQDEASSVVWGMPRAVVHAGLADQILPLDRVAEEIALQVSRSRARS